MPKFFIERPIFAWVIAIFVMLAGIVSITVSRPGVQSPSRDRNPLRRDAGIIGTTSSAVVPQHSVPLSARERDRFRALARNQGEGAGRATGVV